MTVWSHAAQAKETRVYSLGKNKKQPRTYGLDTLSELNFQKNRKNILLTNREKRH
jgi:hypothetical protein